MSIDDVINSSLSKKEFLTELSDFEQQLKQEIEAKSLNLDPSPEAIIQRRERVLKGDFRFFCYTYFPHHIYGNPSKFQEHFFKLFPQIVISDEGSRDWWVAPRGECKSSLLTKIGPCYIAVIALLQREEIRKQIGWDGDPPPFKDYIVLLGSELKLPTKLMLVARSELEVNPALQMDFPEVMGRTSVWKLGEMVTNTGVKIEPFGADQAVRGTFHNASRPKFLFGDDIITDSEAKSPTERNNRWDWLEKCVDYLGDPDGTVNFLGVGTILNKDDPISRSKRSIGYSVHHFRAIEVFPLRTDLWDKCSEIMLNDDPVAIRDADNSGKKLSEKKYPSYLFYLKNKTAMEEKAVTSWPEVRSLYTLMRAKLKNKKAFNTELQGDPRSEEDKVFYNIRFWIHSSDRWREYAACDPSMGKSQTSDPSAIVIGAWDTRKLCLNVQVADSKRRVPSKILADIIRYQTEFSCIAWGFENNNAYEYMRSQFINEGLRQHVVLPLRGVTSVSDQAVRIESIEPQVNDGLEPKILLKHGLFSLEEQLDEWPEKPNGHHYDLLVALHILYMVAATGSGGIPSILTKSRSQQGLIYR